MHTEAGEQKCNEGASLLRSDLIVARRLLNESIQMIPEVSTAWYNLGIALHQQKRINAAIRAYRMSLKLKNPPVKSIMSNLSQDLLLAGYYRDGWMTYEHRLSDPKYDNEYFEKRFGPAWKGAKDKRECKHLILVAEQGFGDTLQFLRLAIQLQGEGIEITLFCQMELKELIRKQSELKNITSEIKETGIDKNVLWCPLMSLPHRLGIDGSNIPLEKGYISIDESLKTQWRKRLNRKKGHRLIALHWQGNSKHEKKIYSIGRSFAFRELMKLKQLDNTEFVAIQKGEALNDIKANRELKFVQGQDIVSKTMSFRDTSAILANCDLLISSDSGVVHLAGSMGVRCFVALRWVPEWRWGLEGTSTPWYESVKLYRQQANGEWNTVFEEITKELSNK